MKTATLTNDYHCSITAKVSPSEAFDHICQVSAWWTENFEGSAQALKDVFTIRFGETFATFRVDDFVPHEMIVWYVTDCNLHWLKDKKEWMDTKIVWEVSAKNDVTQVDMTHLGLVPGAECYDSCEKGWDHCIKDSLFRLLTEKEGLPEKRKK